VLISENSENIRRDGYSPEHNADGLSICSYNGVLSVVCSRATSAGGDPNRVDLYQSTDGGASWIVGPELTVPTTIGSLDAISDHNGVHVVWDDRVGLSAYYSRYQPIDDWTLPFQITLPSTITRRPKVNAIGDNVVVSLVNRTTGSSDRGTSRDYDVLTDTWEPSYRLTDELQNGPVSQQNIGVFNGLAHLLILREPFQGRVVRFSKRAVGGNWDAPGQFSITSAPDEVTDYRRKVAVTNSGAHFVFYPVPSSSMGRILLTDNSGSGWTTPEEVYNWQPISSAAVSNTIAASQTGLYIFWSQNSLLNDSQRYFRRRVIALQGNITSNAFWTGNNWISGSASIENGVTVTMKSNSLTTFLSNAQITVKNGATRRTSTTSRTSPQDSHLFPMHTS
jgi:hypothetical protein